MDPSFLPYLRWTPVVLLAVIVLGASMVSSRPKVALRKGVVMVGCLAFCMGVLPYVSVAVFRVVPMVVIGVGFAVGLLRYAKSSPIQRKYGSLAPLLAAHRSGDYEGVLRLCDDPSLARVSGAQLQLMRGCALFHLRRMEEAESQLRAALTRPRTRVLEALTLDQLGQVLLEQGRGDEAIRALQFAEEQDPKRGASFASEAEVYLRGKYQVEKALELAQHAVDLDRRQSAELRAVSLSTSLATLAWALAANGKPAEARESIYEALSHSQPDSMPIRAEDTYLAGHTMLAMGDQAAASEYFRKVTELDPQGLFGSLAKKELSVLV